VKRPSPTASPRGSRAKKRVKYEESDEESEAGLEWKVESDGEDDYKEASNGEEEEEGEEQHPEVLKDFKVETKEVVGEHQYWEGLAERDSDFQDEWLNFVPANRNEKVPVKVEVQVWN
jgi:hypothetical protein